MAEDGVATKPKRGARKAASGVKPPFEFRPRQSRGDKQAETRTRILQSADFIFKLRGYHPATLEEISEAAGYSKGAVYSNFASKDELFLALLEQITEERIAGVRKVFAGEKGIDATLQNLEKRWHTLLDADRQWSHVEYEFVLHALRNPDLAERMRVIHDRLRDAVRELFIPYVRDAQDEIGDIETLTSAVMAVIRGVTMTNLQDPVKYPGGLHPLLIGRLFRRR